MAGKYVMIDRPGDPDGLLSVYGLSWIIDLLMHLQYVPK